jgi:hypothetical protein
MARNNLKEKKVQTEVWLNHLKFQEKEKESPRFLAVYICILSIEPHSATSTAERSSHLGIHFTKRKHIHMFVG